MAGKQWQVREDDGTILGPFDRESEAIEAAEDAAAERGHGLRWLPVFGKRIGKPTDRGVGLLGCVVEEVNE